MQKRINELLAKRHLVQTISGTLIYLSTLVALVTLILQHETLEPVLFFAGPVVSALLVSAQIGIRSNNQDKILDKISHQTNGVLAEKIRTAVAEALKTAQKPNEKEQN